MKLRYGLSILTITAFGLVGSFSCSKDVQSSPSYIFKKAPDTSTAAEFNGQKITFAELNSGIENDLYEAKKKVFELQMNKLKSMVLEKLVKADPNNKGLTNDQFLDRYIAKGVTVSESEIMAFAKERGIPNESLNDQMKSRVKQFLTQQKKRAAIENWVNEKTKKSPISVYLKKPARPVFDVKAGNSPFKGGASAKVTVVEYSDFQCPFCKKGASLLGEINKKYGNKVKIVFKQYPLPFHKQAPKAAEASLCANELGGKDKFWKYHDALFADQGNLQVADLVSKASAMGLDSQKFKDCVTSGRHAAAVMADIESGKAVGVKSTPTFFVNGKLVAGAQPLAVFSEIIDEELKK